MHLVLSVATARLARPRRSNRERFIEVSPFIWGRRVTIENVNVRDKKAPQGNRARHTVALPPDVYRVACPTRQALDRIADKWTALIVGVLEQKPHRFNEVHRAIEGISHKVLTQTLRDLETDGLVERRVLSTRPASVQYSLTPLGRSLTDPLAAIRDWAERHISSIHTARAKMRASVLRRS